MTPLSHAQALAEVDRERPGPEVTAFFDLDGTLVKGFTAAAFVEHRLRQGELDGHVVAEILRLGLDGILGKIHFDEFLALSLGTLAGRPAADLEALGRALFEREIRARLQGPIVELVFAHRERDHTVVLATSATSFQAEPVARALGIENVLCNRLAVDEIGLLTGRIEGSVIWAEGKALAVQTFAERRGLPLADSFFYADGSEDVASMFLVGHPRPVNPARGMRAVAERRGWPVIQVPETTDMRGVRPRGSRLRERWLAPFVRIGGVRNGGVRNGGVRDGRVRSGRSS
jgi:putative phosphoserine phosphatase/1-acylglycerol-3-phosphate O-acyltransferase